MALICSLLVFPPAFIYGEKFSTFFFLSFSCSLKSRKDFILASQWPEDSGQAGFPSRVSCGMGSWCKNPPWAFCAHHVDSAVNSIRFTDSDCICIRHPMTKTWHSLASSIISSLLMESRSIPSFLLQHWRPKNCVMITCCHSDSSKCSWGERSHFCFLMQGTHSVGMLPVCPSYVRVRNGGPSHYNSRQVVHLKLTKCCMSIITQLKKKYSSYSLKSGESQR